jgi:hypothetical protein
LWEEEMLLCNELRTTYWSIDINAITPVDALYILQEVIKKLRK